MTSRFGFLKPVARRGENKAGKPKDKGSTKSQDCQKQSSSVHLVDSVLPTSSHENGLDDAGGDDTVSDEYSNNNSVTQNGKKKLERTSNNLSKLADKLNTGRSNQNGEPGGKQAQPAFRRRGSSNIAKLNTGNSKERTGTSQIHGQTPYMKSPKFDTKQPAGKHIPNSGMIAQRGLPRFTVGSNVKGSASSRVEDDKAAPGANETFEIPSADDAATDKSASHTGRTSSSPVASTASTTNVIRRPAPAGGVARSGIRPPSGAFSGSTSGAAIARAETKMKPPTNLPPRGSKQNLLKGNKEELRNSSSKGIAVRRGSAQETSKSKDGSTDTLKGPGVVTSRQKAPSRELQTMADKLISYSSKKLQRPLSMCSGSDLLQPKNAGQKIARKSIGGSNLRTGNSSSLQDLSRRLSSSNQDIPNSEARSRKGSMTFSDKDTPMRKSKSGSMNSLNAGVQGFSGQKGLVGKIAANVVPRKISNELAKPRSRTSSKTLGSTTSDFGIGDVTTVHYQSTPVNKYVGFEIQAAKRSEHPFDNAVNEDISAVFCDDNNDLKPSDLGFTNVAARRILNTTFDGGDKNRTFDAVDIQNSTYLKIEKSPNENATVINNITFSKDENPEVDEQKVNSLLDSNLSTESQTRTQDALNVEENVVVSKPDSPPSTCAKISKVASNSPDKTLDLGSAESKPVFRRSDKKEPDLDGYCSDNFLMNESMPHLDDSLLMNITDEPDAAMSSSPLDSNEKKLFSSKGNQNFSKTEPHNVPLPKTASRSLEFSEPIESSIEKNDDAADVLATSLVNDSYDVIKLEDATAPGDNSMPGTRDGNKEVVSERKTKEIEKYAHDTKDTSEDGPVDICEQNRKETVVDNDNPPSADIDEERKPLAANRFQIPVPDHDLQENEMKSQQVDAENVDQRFLSLLSQTVETFLGDTIGNDNTVNNHGGLITPIDSVESKHIGVSSLPPSQMKIAARRRSLIRRNTSPYATSSDSLSLGTSFRIPREASIAEMEDGNVMIDEATFRHCQNDVRIMKTNLLRLKRLLTETDIMSPLMKHPSKFGISPPVTPTKSVLLSRSFSDASSWLAKSRKTPDFLINKTDEDKVEDEIKEMKEKVTLLERENEELKHDLESKDYTIKLLQTQLENQEYSKQVELLTEEKKMLHKELEELKEKLSEELGSTVTSYEYECLKQPQSASKIKAEIVKAYYEQADV
ncbi:uncharacterized protein LOC135682206 isoform X1 [Rhopilema esculentum]|uniref:uncharacterized protein LOC135682206 isoform X1 n=1 Tax=Rhopilema esculentum TaxID=499914 RepID=UPI0031E32977